MKRQEFVQIKGLDLKELKIKVGTLREEIANLILDKNMKKLKDLKTISKKKKELAQILTVIRQKELLEELETKTIKTDEIERIHGLEVSIVTNAKNHDKGLLLFKYLGIPFSK